MFTGLVEALGRVVSLDDLGEQARLTLSLPFADELALGDSVAVNGCCLTVATLGAGVAGFDLLSQTLKVTSLGQLRAGGIVNTERAMAAGGRFGGHFVQGHVDGVGKVLSLEPRGQDHVVTVVLPKEISSLCMNQGSLTVDGISLTIAALEGEQAVFWITPHTWQHTHLSSLNAGDSVNLESDMLAKYVDRILSSRLAQSATPSGI